MKNFIVFCVLFFSCLSFGQIPRAFQENIEADCYEWQKISRLGFTFKQMSMLFDRYINHLDVVHKKLADRDYKKVKVIKEIKKCIDRARSLNRNAEISLEHHLFEGHEIPLVVSQDEEEGSLLVSYIIKGIRPSTLQGEASFSDRCLSLEMAENSKVMSISWVGTKNAICPLPIKDNVGNYLLKLAESIARSKGAQVVHLQDCSSLTSNSTVTISFKTLYTFKNGQTWYNSHGYFSARGREYDLELGSRARNFSLKRVQEIFDDIEKNKERHQTELKLGKEPDIKKRIDNFYKNFSHNNAQLKNWIGNFHSQCANFYTNDCLGDFFFWLWQTSPEQYKMLESFVSPLFARILLPLTYYKELDYKLNEVDFYKLIE